MALFRYEAFNLQGQVVTGEISADSQTMAINRLQEGGLTAYDLQETKDKTKKKSKPLFGISRGVSLGDLSVFSRQLGAMINAGIPVTRAISTLSKQTTNQTMAEALEAIAHDVEGGSGLGDAFERHPKVFNELYVSMLRAGELGGILETTLLRLAEQLRRDKQLSDSVKSAMNYPRIIMIFASVVFFAMLIFLVPIFEGMIVEGTEIPGISKVIFNLSASVRGFWYFWLLGAAVFIVLLMAFIKSPTGHRLYENNKLHMPVFGELNLKSVIARFCRTLATLLEGGIPIVQALQSAGPTAGSDVLAAIVDQAAHQIEEGRSIAAPLEQSGVFPPMVTHMIAVGEESGTLPDLLDRVADFYEEDVTLLSRQLAQLLEPFMLIGIGLLVGSMIIAMYIPMFTSIVNSAATGG
ncbi:MAG: type II secretion system F family protein [Gracilibacteraceae bacterium]|jgi:type IV pilus assembly protein PilC|nr:type II secretion system F family protein [Gracilibacteraceae bacterium]